MSNIPNGKIPFGQNIWPLPLIEAKVKPGKILPGLPKLHVLHHQVLKEPKCGFAISLGEERTFDFLH
jgi:hypothetical protein